MLVSNTHSLQEPILTNELHDSRRTYGTKEKDAAINSGSSF